ncbi:MAG: hypothetical protein ACYCUM_07250 [Solirubrobacteraceae bacterium]
MLPSGVAALALCALVQGCASASSASTVTGSRSKTAAASRHASAKAHASRGSGAGDPHRSAHSGAVASASSHASAAARDSASARRRYDRPPGSLPQTSALPSSHTVAFRDEVSALWRAIVLDRPSVARSAFFPIGAYVQLKGIENPLADYRNRLLREYALDIGAAHRLLGRGASTATLLGVRVPAGYAHWITPGVCYNTIGYYETPNSRMIYRENGRVRSFGIASMISWRGVWYVVHLGAILREAEEGIVESPTEGAGVSEPSSTC